MTAETQPGYIMLTADINKRERELQKLTDQKAGLNTEISAKNKKLKEYQVALADWQNAGDSDQANKNAKIKYYSLRIEDTKAEIAALDSTLKNLGYDIADLTDEIAILKAQRDAFVATFKEQILAGKSIEEANRAAENKADSTGKSLHMNWKNIALIILAVLLAGLGIYFITKNIKK